MEYRRNPISASRNCALNKPSEKRMIHLLMLHTAAHEEIFDVKALGVDDCKTDDAVIPKFVRARKDKPSRLLRRSCQEIFHFLARRRPASVIQLVSSLR